MNDPKLDEVRSWLIKARQDLEASAWLLESPQPLYGAVDSTASKPPKKRSKHIYLERAAL